LDSTGIYVTLTFYVFAAIAVVGGVFMIFTRDMVRSALWLVLSLGCLAAIYVLLSADFLAVAQVLVYIGAIMILMLFAIMLTPGQVDMPALGQGQQVAAAVVALLVFGTSLFVILTHSWNLRPQPVDTPTPEILGSLLYSTYALPLLLAAVLLTAAMIGALVIANEE
jgi:NADH-quinone oxidoreductase subunit J